MLKEFMKYMIEECTPIEQMEIDGRLYSSRQMHPMTPPQPKALHFNTLQGLLRYANTRQPPEEYMLHIIDEKELVFCSLNLDDFGQRMFLAKATPGLLPDQFPFGRYLNPEEFCIQLRTKFIPSHELETLISVAGNISYTATVDVQDDGLSQTVGQKAGVVLKARTELPTVIMLQPYRTFHEIMQPSSPFLVRARKQHDIPELALFAADAGEWKMQAVERIAEHCAMKLNPAISVFW